MRFPCVLRFDGAAGTAGTLIDVYNDGTLNWEYRSVTFTAPSAATGTWILQLGMNYPTHTTVYYTGFRLEESPEQSMYSSVYFKKFRLNIFLNDNPALSNEFTQLGGKGYTTIPYEYTAPVIGGVSKQSLYYRTIKRLAGFPDELKFLKYSDRLKLQKEAVKLDETLQSGEIVQQFENRFIPILWTQADYDLAVQQA